MMKHERESAFIDPTDDPRRYKQESVPRSPEIRSFPWHAEYIFDGVIDEKT